ncbi:MAG: hypothetical protein QF351_04190, partial [Phycisphaerales bacterium]|nr:hypothetical protein [Phycisphaerales bacterium]
MRTSTVVALGLFALGLSGVVAVALRATDRDPSTSNTTTAALPEPTEDRGGWVRIADEQGRLKQQYRADTLEPSPDDLGPGWIKVQGADLRLIDPNTAQEIRLRAEQGELLAPSGG